MKKNTKLAIGAGVGLLALGAAAYFLGGSSSSSKTTTTGTGKPTTSGPPLGLGRGGGGGHHGGGGGGHFHGGGGFRHDGFRHRFFPARTIFFPYDYGNVSDYEDPGCTYLGIAGRSAAIPAAVEHIARNHTWHGEGSFMQVVDGQTYRLDAVASGVAVYLCPVGY